MRIKFKIQNLKFKIDSGYTILELLAVIAVLGVVMGIVTSIVFSTFRGSAKTKINTEISQNGQYALSVISETISDSRGITQVGGLDIEDCTTLQSSNSSITFRRIDGGKTTISCEPINGISGPMMIASNSASLINTKLVQVSSCSFSCSQVGEGLADPYAIPIINVSFTISELNTGLNENNASARFKTSSSLRTYSP